MPCSCDGYELPTEKVIAASRALLVIEELRGNPSPPWRWQSPPMLMHYKEDQDVAVAKACKMIKKVDVTQCSLELQIWWRDHQEADRKREANANAT